MKLNYQLFLLLLGGVMNTMSLKISFRNEYSLMCTASHGPVVHQFKILTAQCSQCASKSYERFIDNEKAADSKGTWIDNKELDLVLSTMSNIRASRSSKVMEFIASSPFPIYSNLLVSTEFDITMFHAPRFSAFPPRKHNPGTILLYRNMYGNSYIRTFINKREIKYDVLEDAQLVRMGGTSRIFGSSDEGCSAILEIALHPPRRGNEVLESSDYFEEKSNLLKITVTEDDTSDMFVSLQEYQNSELSITSDKDSEHRTVLSALRESVGGLGSEMESLVRRVLASRRIDSDTFAALGLSHVRGVLLYGPPGCGKTLIARQLAKALNAREPKIVNGPELLDKFVGEAERNIRNLFVDAQEEWSLRGPKSELHVVIFDELDSIAKSRGSLRGDASGVRDSVVNQLLVLLDGVRSLDNVLVVGLTNRKELIDPALLRPGRLEVHVEVGLPDLRGRLQILRILLGPMVAAGHLHPSEQAKEWMSRLATRTAGWTGADLTGLVRSAASFAILRQERYRELIRVRGGVVGLGDSLAGRGAVVLLWRDFERAFVEVGRPRGHRWMRAKEVVSRAWRWLRARVGSEQTDNEGQEGGADGDRAFIGTSD